MDVNDYQRRYADQYSGKEWFETELVRIRRGETLASLARHPHGDVLEVGCGLEPLFEFVDEFERWTVVEPSPEFVRHAAERAGTHRNVVVVPGFLEDVAPSLRAFDFIVASSLLHEVPDPGRLLATMRSLCSETTIVHVNVPNVRSFHRLLAMEMGLIQDVFEPSEMERKFQRTTRFDQRRLRETCESAGFEIVKAATYFVKPFTHRQMEGLIDDGILERSVIDALVGMSKYMPDLGAEMYVDLRLARKP
jgi:SAM-dependent methyltransferase